MALQVNVTSLAGETWTIEAEPSWTVFQFKSEIQALTGLKPYAQKLVCNEVLRNKDALETYTEGSTTLELTLCQYGLDLEVCRGGVKLTNISGNMLNVNGMKIEPEGTYRLLMSSSNRSRRIIARPAGKHSGSPMEEVWDVDLESDGEISITKAEDGVDDDSFTACASWSAACAQILPEE